MKTEQLFIQRMSSSWRQAIRIISLIIGGGGTPIVVGAMVIFLSIAYSRFLLWLPKDVPISYAIAFLLSLPLTFSRLRTWIQPADLTFLLPLETKMKNYFRYSFIYSTSIHLIRLLLVGFILFPLYQLRLGNTTSFGITIILLCLLQVWNSYISWLEDRLTSFQSSRYVHTLLFFRWLINGWISFFLLTKHEWISLFSFVVPILHLFYLRSMISGYPYPWMLLSERERKTLMKYYSIAGWFVDLPHIRFPVKERKWLTWFLEKLAPRQKAFSYLYWRTFFRHGDLFAIYLRILLWATVIILFLPNLWIILATLLFSIWLIAIQLPQIALLQRYPLITQLYPITQEERISCFSRMCWLLLASFTLMMVMVGAMTVVPVLYLLLIGTAGCLLGYFLSYVYIPKQIREKS
ncbi:ABC transporter permease [Thermoflavimicrobium dichotomicum]|uniref:ABC-2 type transport system permease protein n=1 Tax=Thermoflavimicrobium dichotomicum TaxID=46223 RepID=A0A1I3R9Z8_9BACL|nr:ABC transporter permease [Thermoflavimicrobium dichotomicum]SFJ42157.1 ABC-2 type transport system permease protein [Thermoflavimicrobium dichotomicum]